MSEIQLESFPPEVIKELQYYVYRLIDPRNAETFYVGKGKGNRVFNHVQGAIEEDSSSEKISRIRQIHLANLNVGHIIHRHGLTEDQAIVVEAALIDAYPGLTNAVKGHYSDDFGVMHASQIIKTYSAKVAEFQHKALIISINRSALDSSIYEATRFAWRLNKTKAESAEIILASVQGRIVDVFVAERWLEATSDNFPGKETAEGRYGFYGSVAPIEIRNEYKDKRIPDSFRKKGASNPIKYSWQD